MIVRNTHARVRPATTARLHGAHVKLRDMIGLSAVARSLELGVSSRARQHLTGPHLSRFRGRGMDYAESRAYMPGDDVRCMDWRVTARSGRPHTKVYQEERERPVFLAVDFAPSMFFGTRVAFKSVTAAHACALIAWAATARGDRIGALVFQGALHREVRPSGGQRAALRVIGAIAALGNRTQQPDAKAVDLSTQLARVRRVARPGSLVCLISDFYGLNDVAEQHLRRLCAHNDVLVCWVRDPLEGEPPPPGLYPVTYGDEVAMLDTTTASQRAAYVRAFEARRDRLYAICNALSTPIIALATNEDVLAGLKQVLGTARVAHA